MPDVQAPPAIRVRGLGKTYRLWASPGARLAVPLALRFAAAMRPLLPAAAGRLEAWCMRHMRTHQALTDVSFTLARGRALGIVGLNGSGKSTLLQIIAGVLPASTGTVEIHGRIAALLELGSGFNTELTGRENVRINAAILGLSPARVDALFDDIVAFADIGGYIDEPVKTYSSGMALRLAFAVQVHTDPDILIVDEALAVGDAAFQAKAMARIDEILAKGTTLLFVGHDLNAVKAFCHEAMLLERGAIQLRGLPDEVVTEYLYRIHKRALGDALSQRAEGALVRFDDGYGMEDSRVVEATINGVRHVGVGFGGELRLDFQLRVDAAVGDPHLIVDVLDAKGLQLTGRRIPLPRDGGTPSVSISMQAHFQQGIYRIRTRVVDAPSLSQTTILARQEGKLSFEIVDDSRELFTGLYPVPMDIRVADGP